jgi:hypothetical protein
MPSSVNAAPEAVAAASADLTGIEQAIRETSAAGADEVSAAIAHLFGDFAEEFHHPGPGHRDRAAGLTR